MKGPNVTTMTTQDRVSVDAPLPDSDLARLHAAIAGLGTHDDDMPRARWSAGYIIGFIAGLSDDDVELVDKVVEAQREVFAAPYDLATAVARWELLGSATFDLDGGRFFRACGVRAGWKAGTSHRPDVDECGLCEERILTGSQGVRCDHGVFCDEDCQSSVCRRGCGLDGYDL